NEEKPEDADSLRAGQYDIPAGRYLDFALTDLAARSEPYGGTLAELLASYLAKRDPIYKDYKNARAALPPPLFREGEKVQPEWLFKFLRNPPSIRPQRDEKTGSGTLLLRMPRFSMSDEEAMTLVNYFAAVDKVNNPGEGLHYPYVPMPQQ